MNAAKTFFTIAYHPRIVELLRYIRRNCVLILMYHRFSDKEEPFKVSHKVFENQIQFLRETRTFISLKHYSDVLHGQRDDLPRSSVILTIDDGYWDNYDFAFPVLKKYGIQPTIFLTTDFVTRKAWLWSNKLEHTLKSTRLSQFAFPLHGSMTYFRLGGFERWHATQLQIFNYLRTLPEDTKNLLLTELAQQLRVHLPEQTQGDFLPLTRAQIVEMAQHGIDFGSHTCSHPILTRLTPTQLAHELQQSKMEIENLIDREVTLFCYPNGTPDDFDGDVISTLAGLSYTCAVTAIPGLNKAKAQDPFVLRRMSIATDAKIALSRACAGL